MSEAGGADDDTASGARRGAAGQAARPLPEAAAAPANDGQRRPSSSHRLPLLGGARDGEETSLASAARFTPGERVLVYLESWEQGWRPVGMNQGVWTMVEEPTSGRDVLVKVHREYTVTGWDEAEVQLPPPAIRKYAAGTRQPAGSRGASRRRCQRRR